MDSQSRPDLTQAVQALTRGDAHAADRFITPLYHELRELAAGYLRRERPDHTLEPTALVHEAYLRLVKQENLDWKNRAHFLGWAAKTMRQVLVNHARDRAAQKRGGKRRKVPLENVAVSFEERAFDLLALDAALEKLATLDAKKTRIVELRFFGGMTVPEVAEVLDISRATVEREWRFARAWLHGEIQGGSGPVSEA